MTSSSAPSGARAARRIKHMGGRRGLCTVLLLHPRTAPGLIEERLFIISLTLDCDDRPRF
jgi:hypothetical protein